MRSISSGDAIKLPLRIMYISGVPPEVSVSMNPAIDSDEWVMRLSIPFAHVSRFSAGRDPSDEDIGSAAEAGIRSLVANVEAWAKAMKAQL